MSNKTCPKCGKYIECLWAGTQSPPMCDCGNTIVTDQIVRQQGQIGQLLAENKRLRKDNEILHCRLNELKAENQN